MKVFCVISLAVLIYQAKPQEPSRSETLERLRSDLGIKAMTVCIAKEGGTDADVDGFLEGVVPYTKIEQCLNSCLGRKIGIVSFCLTSRYVEKREFKHFIDISSTTKTTP